MIRIAFDDNQLIDFLNTLPQLGGERANRDCLLKDLSGCPVHTISRSDAQYQDIFRIVNCVKKWGKVRASDEYAIELVMESARVFVKNTELEKKLDDIEGQFGQSIGKQNSIPLVIVAMTLEQAKKLDWESIFQSSSLGENFIRDGEKNKTKNLTSCYGDSSDQWKPFQGMEESIYEMVDDLVGDLNKDRNVNIGNRNIDISLYNLSTMFLSSIATERSRARAILERSGGIVIIDMLSMYHPDIQHIILSQGGILNRHNPVAMVIISPFRKYVLETHKLIKDQIHKNDPMQDAFDFFEKYLDLRYEFGIADVCNLRRWLASVLPVEKRKKSGLTSEQRDIVIGYCGNGKEPIGELGKVVIGEPL